MKEYIVTVKIIFPWSLFSNPLGRAEVISEIVSAESASEAWALIKRAKEKSDMLDETGIELVGIKEV